MTDKSGKGYAGQAGTDAVTSPFNQMYFLFQVLLGSVRTMVPVKVMAVTNTGGVEPVGFVDVQPLVDLIDGLGKASAHGTIFGVPYSRIQGGKNAVIMDPEVGDVGVMAVADRDISSVKENKGQATPGSRRRFSLADGVYLGGILNDTPEQYVQFTADGMKVADKNGNVIELSSSGVAVTATNFTWNGQVVQVAP